VSLSSVIDSMLASGCTREQIAAVVKADEAERATVEATRLEAKRLSGAARQRKKRERDRADVTHVTRDMPLPAVTERDERDMHSTPPLISPTFRS
jgi:hypothetical protein